MFQPRFTITPAITKALMAIEADRQLVAGLPLTTRMLDSLRRTARLLSTHYSTQIEGNQLSPAQVEAVIAGQGNFPGRERDEAEVRHYYSALEQVESLGRQKGDITEKVIRVIHGLVMTGQAKPTPYRDGQNVIRDNRGGAIVYYRALSVGESHNYYFGRAEGDVTAFVDYFCRGMADAFGKVRGRAEQVKQEGSLDQSPRLRQLTPQQRQALGLFLRMKQVSARDVATFFKATARAASALCVRWVDDGFLVVTDPSKKHRRYGLAGQYESLVAGQVDPPPATGGMP